MTETVTQFVARVLRLLPCDPPPEKRGAERWAYDSTCWLCGGETGGKGWPQSVAISPTFTQQNTAKCSDSNTVCCSCAALTRAETFQSMVRSRGIQIKIWTQAGWHCYSHLILEDGSYSAPTRKEMRAVLLSPPAGKWLLSINTTGQKHTIFRGTVASGRDMFPVQMDESTIWCRAASLRACMADFEAICALGFSKDSILTGQYNHTQMMKVGLSRWRPAEQRMELWRADDPGLLSLVHMVALGPAEFEPVEPAKYEKTPSETKPAVISGQMEMF